MNKLFLLLFLICSYTYSQEYVVNNEAFEGFPLDVFVGKIPLKDIPAEVILVSTDVPTARKFLAGRVGLKYCNISYGQPQRGSVYNQQLCISQTPSQETRILAESIVFFNILKLNGWEYKGQVGVPGAFQFIFEKTN